MMSRLLPGTGSTFDDIKLWYIGADDLHRTYGDQRAGKPDHGIQNYSFERKFASISEGCKPAAAILP
jgi:hypothetical protein